MRKIHEEIASFIDAKLRDAVDNEIQKAVTIRDARITEPLQRALLADVLKNLAAREGFRLEVMR